jgi:anti-sigma B factor antagonist
VERVSVEFEATSTDLGDGVAVVSIVGEADLFTAPELKQSLDAALEGGATAVLVDLSRTTFIDSTTLGILTGALRQLRPRGGELGIVCTDPSIRKVFELTLLDRVFSLFETVGAGVAGMRNGGAPEPPALS